MNKTLTILVCIMVAGVVVGASLPIFDSITASSDSVHNEGAGWVRFALDRNAGTTYTLSYTEDENGFYIDNGTNRQTYDDSTTLDFETILYADSNLSVWVDGAAIHILGTIEGNPVYLERNSAFTIVRDAEGVTLSSEGTDLASFGVPTWAYIPVSTGNYGFFLAADLDDELGNGVRNYPSDMPLAVVGGGFAGVYAYNDIFRYNGLGLSMKTVYDDDGLFYGAYWDQTAASDPESLDPLDPSAIDLDPAVIDLDPIDIDLDPLNPDAQIMSVPTPTYVDGEWGYKLETVDNVQKAIIQSYSGSGGNIVVPSTVGGYDVYRFGDFAPSYGSTTLQVIDNTAISSNSTLTLPNGLVQIGSGSLYNVTNIGTLTIPDSVTAIGNSAFYGCTGLTTLTIPDSVITIENSAFRNCTGLTGTLTIPGSVTTIGISVFRDCTGLTGLVLLDGIEKIDRQAFYNCTSMTGPIVFPDSLTSIGQESFYHTKFTGTLIVSESVAFLGNSAFSQNSFENVVVCQGVGSDSFGSFLSYASNLRNVVIATDSIPSGTNLISNSSGITEVLDLSDTVDYSVNRYGMPATATYSDSIGDCFGFVSVVDMSGSDGGIAKELIAMLPLIMVLGLVLVAVGIFIWNRM